MGEIFNLQDFPEIITNTDDKNISLMIQPWNQEELKIGENVYNICPVTLLEERYMSGWLIFRNNVPKYYITIYEPEAYLASKKGFIAFTGHEELITLSLEEGEVLSVNTR